MHPLNSDNFGPSGIAITFNNGTSVVSGHIVKQTSWTMFLVSDGTTEVVAELAKTPSEVTSLPLKTFTIPVLAPSTAAGATFGLTYVVNSSTIVAGGTGFVAGDTLSLSNGATYTVATINGGAAATLTLTNASKTYTNIANSTALVATALTGAGTGLTVTVKYSVSAISVTGGTGYTVGLALEFPGLIGTAIPSATVATIGTGGVPLTVTIASGGTNITTAPTSVGVTSGTEHAARLSSKLLTTVEGHNYLWSLSGTTIVAANYPPNFNTFN